MATVGFHLTNLDILASRTFYDPATGAWPIGSQQPWRALYLAGEYPGLLLGLAGLAVALAGCRWSGWREWRKPGLYLACVLAVGPGLITNSLMKGNWGRPRPAEITAFGGDRAFVRVGGIGWEGEGRSFPSGHAAMGFYLITPAFFLYRRRPGLAAAFVVLGLTAGGLLGFARICQGRHFASDVLWSLAVVYFTGLLLAAAFRFNATTAMPAGQPLESVLPSV